MLFAALAVAVFAIVGVAYVVSDGFKHADEYDSEIVDMAGRTVEYKSDPQRIAMLGPSALRLNCYAEDMDKIFGI